MNNTILKYNNIPFPISVNESLMPQSGRLIKSHKARAYLKDMQFWAISNKKFIDKSKEIIKTWFSEKKVLRVDTFLAWPKIDLLVDEGNKKATNYVQQKDGTNRIKQLHDALAEILEIDDRYFFYADCCKVISDTNQRQCMVTIKTEKVIKMSDVEAFLKQSQAINQIEIEKHIKKAQEYKVYEQ